MVALRSYHTISSYGVLPASSFAVKYRGNSIPVRCEEGSDLFNSFRALKFTVSCPIEKSLFGTTPVGRAFVIGPNDTPIYCVPSRKITIYGTSSYRGEIF